MRDRSLRDGGDWFKSSYTGDPNGECVEARYQPQAPVGVRDSKQNGEAGQPVLAFASSAWSAFVGHVAQ